jgi:hypothetical protein
MSVTTREQIFEVTLIPTDIEVPEVPIFEGVDLPLLTIKDVNTEPYFVTWPIAEVGRRSHNGLLYDDYLVNEIATQLFGLGGIRGHIPEDQVRWLFPIDSIDWVGTLRKGKFLYGKGYIPPGEDRDYMTRLIARGGLVGTSLMGLGERIKVDEQSFRLRNFLLEQLDWVPWTRASLQMSGRVAITTEMRGQLIEHEILEEDEITDEVIMGQSNDKTEGVEVMPVEPNAPAAEAPQPVQVAAEPVSEAAVTRQPATAVIELSQSEYTRLAESAYVVTELSAYFPDGTDIVAAVSTILSEMKTLTDLLGTETSVVTKVYQLHERAQAMETRERSDALIEAVNAATPWKVYTTEGVEQLDSTRKTLLALAEARITGVEIENFGQVVEECWTIIRPMAEANLQRISGPRGIITLKPGGLSARAEAVAAAAGENKPASETYDREGIRRTWGV